MSGNAPPEVGEALLWLAEVAHENLGTEIALRAALTAEVFFAYGADGQLAGVSVSSPGGQWFLESDGPAATADLVVEVAGAARAAGVWPSKVTTSGTVKHWLRPLLAERDLLPVREHDLLAMVCRKQPDEGEGRWATPADRPALERYQRLYNEEQRTVLAPDWDALLSREAVAVLERDGGIAAVVKRTTDTARYATIGGTWTDPRFRGRGLAKGVTAFLVGEILVDRPLVHLVVDDDNTPAISLYRSLHFDEVGSCYMGYLTH